MGIQENVERVQIDPEVLKQFEGLPNTSRGRVITWTPSMDELLRRFWKVKKGGEVAKLLKVSIPTCTRRYEIIMREQNGG